MIRSRAGVVMIILGVLAYFIGPYGDWHYRDEATKRADSYLYEHLQDFKSGDYMRARDRYLAETRIQRGAFRAVQFAGFALACWGASKLRHKPQTS